MKTIKNHVYIIVRSIHQLWAQYHFLVPPNKIKAYFSLFNSRITTTIEDTIFNFNDQEEYLKWIEKNEKYEDEIKLTYNPKFSVIIPIYNIEKKYLSECLDSILNQTYRNFEICLADDKSSKIETLETLEKYEKIYSNIKIIHRNVNGNISAASNSALSIATGDFVILMDDDDTISKQTLYKIAKVLNTDNRIDFVYTDEDKISENEKRCTPHFKSDWSPDSLMSTNYISHLTIIRRSILQSTSGFNSKTNGAQDYDIEWKAIEKSRRIFHIPEVLYHWRMVKGSTSMSLHNKKYALNSGEIVLKDKLARDCINGNINKVDGRAYYQVTYNNYNNPNVEIIIYNYNNYNEICACIDSLYRFTDYTNFKINVFMEKHIKFSENACMYKIINNIDCLNANNSENKLYLFLDAHTRFINKNWLSVLIGQSLQKHVGVCGPKIIDHNNLVRHYGIVGGINEYFDYMYDGINKYETGYFGNLLCATNVLSIAPDCALISGKKLSKTKFKIDSLGIQLSIIDLCFQLIELGYYNVLIPYSIISTIYEQDEPGINKNININNYFLTRWKKYIDNDPFYNPNFSKKKTFYLDK